MYTVRFLIVESGIVVDKDFESYIKCRNFVNKLRFSKKCRLISCPLFKD